MPDRNKAARLSRRSMLMGAAGAGAAGVAAATLGSAALPALAAGAGPAARGPRADDLQADHSQAHDLSAADLAEPVVVHVRDAARGELEVFRGTAATRLQDRDLAARLVRASTS
jgi:outer membrane receptor protein involved in Fe transport